ncbi:hypothetical protein FY528_08540 [Hymenobacter lutimineralis]|uniref:DUF4142 domain-containing protein n=1 Tax=Hymenobacter lutimineralis TaxID=2606448 RepID=A0A5D6V5I0_9BACT|nr:hypothetical protein [Hymenobacter lutimineralis]TYZ10507.1 hypothetical protein FY528_08540 [Hymenobacter lutimineralis]
MRHTLAFTALLLASVATAAQAQQTNQLAVSRDKTQASPRLNPVVAQRADRLSDQMVRQLRLNGYQASRLRAINEDKVAKMAAIEQKHAGNSQLIDQQCQGVCKERDKELQTILSTDQYSSYYGSRASFYKYDKDYAATAANTRFVNSVQNPAPAGSKGAVLAPASEAPRTTPASTRARGR